MLKSLLKTIISRGGVTYDLDKSDDLVMAIFDGMG